MPYYHSKDEPRVNISREWIELIKPLEREEGKERWGRFYMSVVGYALGKEQEPDFSDDPELQALWQKTNCRPFDKVTFKPGWLKVWKRKGGASNGRR